VHFLPKLYSFIDKQVGYYKHIFELPFSASAAGGLLNTIAVQGQSYKEEN
jgi:hypothetical protein